MSSGKALQEAVHPNQQPPTPSFRKRKKAQERADIRSPTDSMISPCTRKLMKKAAKDIEMLTAELVFNAEDKENTPS